jgi:hypothetical protein
MKTIDTKILGRKTYDASLRLGAKFDPKKYDDTYRKELLALLRAKEAGKPLLEVFVFDFDQPVYGRRIVVEFLRKLRDEERYPDLQALTRQIHADVAHAREYFATASTSVR